MSRRVAGGLRRCDAPSPGPRPKPLALKRGIMRGSRGAACIQGEQSSGSVNVVHTGRLVGCLRGAPSRQIRPDDSSKSWICTTAVALWRAISQQGRLVAFKMWPRTRFSVNVRMFPGCSASGESRPFLFVRCVLVYHHPTTDTPQ